jgi:hypothetical protein
MKKVFWIWILMVLALLALSFAAVPGAGSASSPLPPPELTPPFRPTPTGWPDAPFPPTRPLSSAYQPETHQTSAQARGGFEVPMLPVATVAPRSATLARTNMRARVVVGIIERTKWEGWRRHNVD